MGRSVVDRSAMKNYAILNVRHKNLQDMLNSNRFIELNVVRINKLDELGLKLT